MVFLRLFIVGDSARGKQAETAVRRLCEAHLTDDFELDVVDVVEKPEMAERAKVIATPTLIRMTPEPTRRIVGDLLDVRQVAFGLDLQLELGPDGEV